MQIDNDAGNLTCVISSGFMMLFMPFVTFSCFMSQFFGFLQLKQYFCSQIINLRNEIIFCIIICRLFFVGI